MKQVTKWIGLFLLLIAFERTSAQIELTHISFNGFSATGFGGFFNFSVPVSDADYVSGEIGLDVFSNNGNNVAIAPLLAGYRYTLDRSGTGFYLEPNAGYSFGGTDIQVVDQNGNYYDQSVSGLATGLSFGYLFPQTGIIQFNLGVRYEHIFGQTGQNLFALRISHAFTFGRRQY
jgi:hypothetical protein